MHHMHFLVSPNFALFLLNNLNIEYHLIKIKILKSTYLSICLHIPTFQVIEKFISLRKSTYLYELDGKIGIDWHR